MTNRPVVEVCVDSVESAIAAERGAADRVELCGNLLEGGVTPSAGLIAAVRQAISIQLQVMIRPRGGDFFYTDDEIGIMRHDIKVAKELGADGLVLGILDTEANVDAKRTGELVELARPLTVTFHRAIDMSRDLFLALQTLIDLKIDRVLTSGGEQTAIEGKQIIARLVRDAAERIAVMPGSGIQEQNVRQLIAETGAREIHVGLSAAFASPMRLRNEKVSMGTVKDREYQRFRVTEERVKRLVAAASSDGAATASRVPSATLKGR
jgi:copper homeostasis protein